MDDIQNPKYNEQAPLWLEYWKLGVLIDIRDILEDRLKSLDNTILKYVIPK